MVQQNPGVNNVLGILQRSC